jgi:hypothetical protein
MRLILVLTMTKPLLKPGNLVIRSHADAPHLKKAAFAIEQAVWDASGYLNYTRAHYISFAWWTRRPTTPWG